MDRRSFLRSVGQVGTVAGAAVAAPAATQAEGYRRCEQLHEKLTCKDIPKWAQELRALNYVQPREVRATDHIGVVEQGVAPEWYWFHPDQSQPHQHPPLAPGAARSPRPQHIRRDADEQIVELAACDFVTQIIPGWVTHVLGYGEVHRSADGKELSCQPQTPGPAFNVRAFHPLIVRVHNRIDPHLHLEVSVHQHGGHIPAHSDGHPNFLILPGERRDYFYPNSVPLQADLQGNQWVPRDGEWDTNETQSTMWYHDHAEDITAHNALMGLGGLYFLRDSREDELRQQGILPALDHEIPLVLKDVCLQPITDESLMLCKVRDEFEKLKKAGESIHGEARIHFDPFDHNGTLGNLVLVNGQAYPFKAVRPEAYWLRLLNASLARFYNLEFWAVHPTTLKHRRLTFLRFGRDSWMFQHAISQTSVFLSMANRGDVYLDFAQCLAEDWKEYWQDDQLQVLMVSTLNQKDGRGPGHGDNEATATDLPRGAANELPEDRTDSLPLIQFRVQRGGEVVPQPTHMTEQVELRPHEQLAIPENVRVREFNFERGRGAWQINHRFYDSCTANVVHDLWSTELWILRNRSGGWWHPIHIHLESQQQIYVQARNQRGERIVLKRPDYDVHRFCRDRNIPLELSAEEIETADEKWKSSFAEMQNHSSDDPDKLKFDQTVWNLEIKHDTHVLGPNTEVHLLMRFRTFEGPFVFHCHNLNHEDMRMMYQMDPRERTQSDVSVADEELRVRGSHWYFASNAPHHCHEEPSGGAV